MLFWFLISFEYRKTGVIKLIMLGVKRELMKNVLLQI